MCIDNRERAVCLQALHPLYSELTFVFRYINVQQALPTATFIFKVGVTIECDCTLSDSLRTLPSGDIMICSHMCNASNCDCDVVAVSLFRAVLFTVPNRNLNMFDVRQGCDTHDTS